MWIMWIMWIDRAQDTAALALHVRLGNHDGGGAGGDDVSG